MTTMITIAGMPVDAEDPCAMYAALAAVKAKRLAGEQIEESEIRSPVMQQRVKIASSSIADIDKELIRLQAACQAKTTGCRPTRRWKLRF
ncbi:hypothetical protein [Rhizobium sp. P007]|uniref:hypothetical protein n=1 Tax=Rhizobium phage RR1-A TaxID=929833 RepID=UPI00034266AF|nr:hypothetical protein [Rhizobium sp. P007]YP_008130150.1 hypothetical protein RHXG_00003 [Rhizobium phage RR1-A]AGN34379.1 hypothetical protein RHXG_00003 [Rhizobium phage RR1-A]CAD7058654.1 hypothetical protein RP007_02659 [Rhizobium sp. P007]